MEVDRLEVIVEAEAKKANAELDKLISKLNQVSSAMGKSAGFNFGKGSGASNIKATTASLSGFTKSTSRGLLGA
jgi:hypothetical protein